MRYLTQICNILHKEVLECKRNFSFLFIIATPFALFLFTGLLMGGEVRPMQIAVYLPYESEDAMTMVEHIASELGNITLYHAEDWEGALKSIREGKAQIAIRIPSIVRNYIPEDGLNIKVAYDKDSPLAPNLLPAVQFVIYKYLGLIEEVSFSKEHIKAGSPLMIFFATWIIFGVLMISINQPADLVTTEKERGTLDALLLTTLSPLVIILGKALFVLIAVIAAVMPIIIGSYFIVGGLRVNALLSVILVTSLTAIGFIGVGLIISSFSKSTRQANQLSSLTFLPLIILTGLPDFLLPSFIIPIVRWLPSFQGRMIITNIYLNEPSGYLPFLSIILFNIVILLSASYILKRKAKEAT